MPGRCYRVLLGWMALVGHRNRTGAPRAVRYVGMVLFQMGMVPLLRLDVAWLGWDGGRC